MPDVVLTYRPEDLFALLARLETARLTVRAIANHVACDRPWAAHWLGGDATEVQPAGFREARADIAAAVAALDAADHKIAMLAIGQIAADATTACKE
jgi:hypothetical protein